MEAAGEDSVVGGWGICRRGVCMKRREGNRGPADDKIPAPPAINLLSTPPPMCCVAWLTWLVWLAWKTHPDPWLSDCANPARQCNRYRRIVQYYPALATTVRITSCFREAHASHGKTIVYHRDIFLAYESDALISCKVMCDVLRIPSHRLVTLAPGSDYV